MLLQTVIVIFGMVGFGWFKKGQLTALGLQEQQVDFLIGLFCIVVLFLILKPVIKILIELNWKYLLTYMVTIFLFINIVTISYLYRGIEQGNLSISYVKMNYILFDIISLGIILGVTVLAKRVIWFVKQHKSNSY